jgi:hypothetical protein
MYVRTRRGFGKVPGAIALDRPLRDGCFSTPLPGLGQPLFLTLLHSDFGIPVR